MHSLYFDYCATTPLDPRVQEAMEPFWSVHFGNPASLLHEKGWKAQSAVQKAREQVAQLINCDPSELVFTSGATESNNWVLKGLAHSLRKSKPGVIPHFISSPFEHSSVSEVLKFLQSEGLIELTLAPVDHEGRISIDSLNECLKPNSQVLSVIWCQNEIGTIQKMHELTAWAHSHGLLVHSDATQMVGKYAVDLKQIPVDFLSFSGHKIYGPKGVGALYLRNNPSAPRLEPLLHGGGQEPLGRSGTLNVPGIIGLAAACHLASAEMHSDQEKAKSLYDKFVQPLKSTFGHRLVWNSPETGVSHFLVNFSIPGADPEELFPLLSQICLSTGAACRSKQPQLSPTLTALGRCPLQHQPSFRLSWGRMTTEAEIEKASVIIHKSLKSLRFREEIRAQSGPSQAPPTVLES